MPRTPSKRAARRAAPPSSDSSDSAEQIDSWSGDPIEKPAFLASIITTLEDEAEADHLVTYGTVIIKDKEYVSSLDHSDNLDAYIIETGAFCAGDSNDAAESDSADKGSDEEETEESSCGSEVCK